MKKTIFALALTVLGIGNVSAENFAFTSNIDIPDGNGSVNDPRTISSSITSIQSIIVTLNISGRTDPNNPSDNSAYNGDLWAYLEHSTAGNDSWLINRIGKVNAGDFGNSGNGMQVQLNDSAANGDIHNSPDQLGAVLMGTWQPDGRSAFPDAVTQSSPRDKLLSVFNNQDANGTWTLFIGDASSGATAKLDSWGLEFTGVPEPKEWAAISAAALLGFGIWRRTKQNKAQVVS